MTGDDPNEAYEVVPTEPGPHGRLIPGGPSSGTASRLDTFPEKAELYATDPEYRASLIAGRAWVKAKGK
jgi:hypothetical protein